MTKKYGAIAQGCLTATVALLAGIGSAQAQAPAPGAPLSGAGSFPLSFVVPGTNTSLHVGGFIQLDTRYDMSAFGNAASPGADDNLAPESVELSGNGIVLPGGHNDHGTFRTTAQNSRFSVETRTPSAYGEVKTYLEIDFAGGVSDSGVDGAFNGTSGGTQTNFSFLRRRPRQARLTEPLGPWLFGMTNSNFADLAAWPDQRLDAPIEAGGYVGAGQVKVPQARYTYLLPGGMSLSGSLESNQTGGLVQSATGANLAGTPAGAFDTFNDFNAPGISQKFPAATSTFQIQQPWGHAGFHVAVAQARITNLGGALGPAFGAGVPQGDPYLQVGLPVEPDRSLQYDRQGQDHLAVAVRPGRVQLHLVHQRARHAMGRGSRLFPQCDRERDCLLATARLWHQPPRLLAFGGLTGGVRACLFGCDRVSRPNAAGAWSVTAGGSGLTTLERMHYSADANLMWTPIAGVQFGVEYEWYHRSVWSGAHGSSNRIETQALFAF